MPAAAGAGAAGAPAVLVGYEDAPTARAALRAAADLAVRLGGSLHVAHAVPLVSPLTVTPDALAGGAFAAAQPEDVEQNRAQADADVREHVGRLLGDLRAPWSLRVDVGNPVDILEDQAAEVDAYVVVVGARRSGVGAVVDHLLSGSTSRELERRGRRPLLVVPEPRDEAQAQDAPGS